MDARHRPAPPTALRRMALGFAIAALLVGAGCGSSAGGSEPEAPPPLSKAQLGTRMGDVCQEHTDRQVIAIESFDKKHGLPYGFNHEKASNKQLEEELVKVILPIVRDNIHDLERLSPSPQQEGKFKAFLRALEHGIAYSERDPGWIIDATPEPFAEARELSWKLGTAYCGQA
jgi:hypothetical protein